jgi:hypothetical protein
MHSTKIKKKDFKNSVLTSQHTFIIVKANKLVIFSGMAMSYYSNNLSKTPYTSRTKYGITTEHSRVKAHPFPV